ncbi:MAG: FliM/FliN family flagellar motor C-terminal domain-containing protein [Vicinamibacterales bacterium]
MSSSLISSSSSDLVLPSPYDAIGDLRCPVAVVLGTSTISVRQCLSLVPNMVFRLAQAAGEDLRIDVNGVTVARGEVAIIDTSTAVRLTDFAAVPGRSRRA